MSHIQTTEIVVLVTIPFTAGPNLAALLNPNRNALSTITNEIASIHLAYKLLQFVWAITDIQFQNQITLTNTPLVLLLLLYGPYG